ncbi:MAG: hypothetical protein ABIH26_07550 [Candidatus Eisenbacteria bacterium]
MSKRRIRIGFAGLLALLLLFPLAGCFETTDKSPRKLSVFFSSDVVGSLEPCG